MLLKARSLDNAVLEFLIGLAILMYGPLYHALNKTFQLVVVREVLHARIHRKHTKVMGKILVAGKHLTLGVRGPGEKLSWGETRSSGTGGSHPGQES